MFQRAPKSAQRGKLSDNVLRFFLNLSLRQIAILNKFANPNDLIHETSVHHLSTLTVEGEYLIFYREETTSD